MPVKIYTLSTCSHCKNVKRFLNDCAVKYEFTDVDLLSGEERLSILEEIKRFNPLCSFPTIIIGDRIIVGFREQEIREALGLWWALNRPVKEILLPSCERAHTYSTCLGDYSPQRTLSGEIITLYSPLTIILSSPGKYLPSLRLPPFLQ